VLERLDQEAARACRRVKHGFAETRIERLDHEADDGAGRVEFAGIARRVAHFPQHRFVQRAERVQFVAGGEVDAVDLVQQVAQQIAVDHPVLHALEHGGDHVAAFVAMGGREAAQVGEQPGTLCPIRAGGVLVLVDVGEQFVARDAVGLRCPVAPAVGRFDCCAERLAGHGGFVLALALQIVEEFQEHDPGQHRQAVKVAVEPLVLAHDIARRLQQAAKRLRRGHRLGGFLGCARGLCGYRFLKRQFEGNRRFSWSRHGLGRLLVEQVLQFGHGRTQFLGAAELPRNLGDSAVVREGCDMQDLGQHELCITMLGVLVEQVA
jgi:hypothetical protein